PDRSQAQEVVFPIAATRSQAAQTSAARSGVGSPEAGGPRRSATQPASNGDQLRLMEFLGSVVARSISRFNPSLPNRTDYRLVVAVCRRTDCLVVPGGNCGAD